MHACACALLNSGCVRDIYNNIISGSSGIIGSNSHVHVPLLNSGCVRDIYNNIISVSSGIIGSNSIFMNIVRLVAQLHLPYFTLHFVVLASSISHGNYEKNVSIIIVHVEVAI